MCHGNGKSTQYVDNGLSDIRPEPLTNWIHFASHRCHHGAGQRATAGFINAGNQAAYVGQLVE